MNMPHGGHGGDGWRNIGHHRGLDVIAPQQCAVAAERCQEDDRSADAESLTDLAREQNAWARRGVHCLLVAWLSTTAAVQLHC